MFKTATLLAFILLAYGVSNNAHANTCDWNNPGSNRYTGNQANAVDNYKDIPASIREELKKKINAHQFDDHIEITTIGMNGKHAYTNGRDMHWGQNKMCKGAFSINKWKSTHKENALVYTYSGYSVAIPSVCGNVFRLNVLAGGNRTAITTSIETNTHEDNIPSVTHTPETEIPQGNGGVPEKNKTVTFASDHPVQNGLVPQKEREFFPVPPMPALPYFASSVVSVVPAVPEPSTYALMLLGLCLVIGMTTRK